MEHDDVNDDVRGRNQKDFTGGAGKLGRLVDGENDEGGKEDGREGSEEAGPEGSGELGYDDGPGNDGSGEEGADENLVRAVSLRDSRGGGDFKDIFRDEKGNEHYCEVDDDSTGPAAVPGFAGSKNCGQPSEKTE